MGVSKATVHRRIEDGTVKASRVGARYRVGQSEVERYRDWLMDQTAAALADDF
ncbi:MAG: helix-turn-helix domain-containing protein [Propionibacteriaceae bacterium]|nr:helix-turn-helix domain-containing protein [Propionibacteriaceae bacterium]